MLVLIDNYDSFTYNLVQYFGDLGAHIAVHRNDALSVADVIALKPAGIVISPGPGDPDSAGICLDLIGAAGVSGIPLLGVCLGHQAIGQACGGRVVRANPRHGKVSKITHTDRSVFAGIPQNFDAARYHSLVIDPETVPPELEVTAQSADGIIMGVAHRTMKLHGVQFHPESIATRHGHALLRNFLNML